MKLIRLVISAALALMPVRSLEAKSRNLPLEQEIVETIGLVKYCGEKSASEEGTWYSVSVNGSKGRINVGYFDSSGANGSTAHDEVVGPGDVFSIGRAITDVLSLGYYYTIREPNIGEGLYKRIPATREDIGYLVREVKQNLSKGMCQTKNT